MIMFVKKPLQVFYMEVIENQCYDKCMLIYFFSIFLKNSNKKNKKLCFIIDINVDAL